MDVEELLLTIHAAPLKGDGWAQALSGLADLVRADSAVLFEPQNPSPQFAIAHRLDPSGLVQYAAHYHRIDEWIARGWQVGGFGTGNVTLGESLVSHRELRRSEFHDGFLRPQNIDHGVSVVVEGARNTADAGLTVVNLMRSSRQGAFTHKEHATLQHLARHLVTAVANSRQLARLSERNAQQALALSSVDAGAFLMDAKGLIKPINAQAERILRDGRWLAGPSLRLAPYVRSSAPIDRILAETRLSLGARTLLERTNDAQRALMMFVPL